MRVWNAWRLSHPRMKPNLSEADLCNVKLKSINLREANLSQAQLRGATLDGANLQGANLSLAYRVGAELALVTDLTAASLRRADLRDADLRGADLAGADLRGADLRAADLSLANLDRTDLTDCTMSLTELGFVDLSCVKGLETIRHTGRSIIGIETIYRSQGRIPEVFLRRAGVPDNFIEYMGSLTRKTLEYYSCFISYSTKDQAFAERLYADLQANGVRSWFAPHHVQSGKKLHEQIDAAIRLHERLLLILSPDSIDSEWVKTEIATAREREVKEKKRVLFPVRVGISFEQLKDWDYFDSDAGKSSAREIREYYIPDFSQWKSHDSYQEEFAKLLRDLKKSDEARSAGGISGVGSIERTPWHCLGDNASSYPSTRPNQGSGLLRKTSYKFLLLMIKI